MEQTETKEIQAHLWGQMNVSQLNNQRDLVVTKIALLASIPQQPTTMSLMAALQMALNDLNTLIDNKCNKR